MVWSDLTKEPKTSEKRQKKTAFMKDPVTFQGRAADIWERNNVEKKKKKSQAEKVVELQ